MALKASGSRYAGCGATVTGLWRATIVLPAPRSTSIAMDGDTLVFVEVKTRTGSGAGRPEESVHGLKQHRIRRAAAIFARNRAMNECPMRFDVVAISRPAGRWQLEIIKDAF